MYINLFSYLMTLSKKERINILKKSKETAIKAREEAKKARAIKQFKQELQKSKPKPKYEYETEDEETEDEECIFIFENEDKDQDQDEDDDQDEDKVTLLKKQNELNTEIKDIVKYINVSINCLVDLHIRQLDKRKICFIEIVEDFYHSLIDIVKQFDKIRELFLNKSKLYNKSYIKS